MNRKFTLTSDTPRSTLPSTAEQDTACEEGRLTSTIDLNERNILSSVPDAAFHQPDGYEILGELGRGGMALVYMAREEKLHRIVALKMLRAGGHATSDELDRFRQEAATVARLTHPNIVRIHGVGNHLGVPFLSLELVEGGDLDQFIESKPQPAIVSARIVEALARGIHAAHSLGIIHRDLKPSNVLLTSDAVPKITDFGVAKLAYFNHKHTQTGVVMGTPCYIAPEQARGERDLTSSVDIYSLGAILYELLTGRPPHNAASAMETMMQVIHADPLPPSTLQPNLDRDLEIICLRCLEKNPARRYPTALALAEDLGRYQRGEPILARRTGSIERIYRWSRRHPREAILLAAVFICLLVCSVLMTSFLRVREENEMRVNRYRAEQSARFDAAIGEYNRWRDQALAEEHLGQRLQLLNVGQISLDKAESFLTTLDDPKREEALREMNRQMFADRSDYELIQTLDSVRLEVSLATMKQMTLANEPSQSNRGVENYLRVFREFGLDLREGDSSELTSRLSQAPVSVREHIADTLDNLSLLVGPGTLRDRGMRFADAIDRDPFRSRLRTRFLKRDSDGLRELTLDPVHLLEGPRSCLLLGNMLAELGDEALSENFLRRALDRYPQDFWLNHDLAVHLMTGVRLAPALAVRWMTVARALRPQEKLLDFHLGLTLKLVGRNDEAIRILRLAVQSNQNSEEAHDILARVLLERGDSQDTIVALRDARVVCPNSVILAYRQALTFKQFKRIEESKKAFDELLELPPNRPEEYSCRAQALQNLDRTEESLATLIEAHQQYPMHSLLAFQLGAAYRQAGKDRESLEMFQLAARLEPNLADSYRRIGQGLTQLARYAEAIPSLQRARELEPNRLETLTALAKCLRHSGKSAEAETLFEVIYERQSDDPSLLIEYASFLREINRPGTAKRILESFCSKEPNHFEAHQALVVTLQKLLDFDGAVSCLKDFVSRVQSSAQDLELPIRVLKDAELLAKRNREWQRYCDEKELASDPWERIALARFVDEWYRNPLAAVELYQSAFMRQPRLLHDPHGPARLEAIRVAMRAAGSDSLDPEKQRMYRLRAQDWFTIEVKRIEIDSRSQVPSAVESARLRAESLLRDAEFALVRESEPLEKLPQSESLVWHSLWESLRSLQKGER